ncbi:hypothetical protein CTZ24_05415 [Pantoea phytobeneficialis]|uniref:Uncharacterized protein n=1 Tax=Pantoea phytobeneficialis TaxID=2052056 RepID=A0AAP9KNJ5_9GAMM|nr:hypothetical protein CTZ24_05415 [Pantoea phytobeneficialis]
MAIMLVSFISCSSYLIALSVTCPFMRLTMQTIPGSIQIMPGEYQVHFYYAFQVIALILGRFQISA